MVKILFESESGFKKKFQKLLMKRGNFDSDIDKIVEDIIQKVKTKSDSAVLKLTKNLKVLQLILGFKKQYRSI